LADSGAHTVVITLRPIAVEDAPAVFAAVDGSRAALRRWMSWYRDDYDLRVAERWITDSVAAAEAGTARQFVIVDDTEGLVGVIGFEDMGNEAGRAMLGYWLATAATGRGIGRRAVAQALLWARAQPAIQLVWAVVADVNLASRRVLEANAFRLAGRRGVDERGDALLIYELSLRAPPSA
jgi:ribosomal-protein-serine acetyltransferase